MNNTIVNGNITDIPVSEVLSRRRRVWEKIGPTGCKGIIFFSAGAQTYLTGTTLIATERPMVLVMREGGETALLVPRLEWEHARDCAKAIDRLEWYPEYPSTKHPMLYLKDLLESMGMDSGDVAADSDGYGAHFGYRGPKLSALCGNLKLQFHPFLVEDLKNIKSPFDLKLLHESAKWANLAHTLLQEYTKEGLSEIEVSNRASSEATQAMLRALGPDFRPNHGNNAHAVYRGQIGPNSYFPHAVTSNLHFRRGDTLVTGATAPILGCNTELERVMFLGEPSKEQEYYYAHALAIQDIAYRAIRPGIPCSDVDKAVMAYFEENGLMPHWRHHTGHAVGFAKHERPFFDINDNTIIQPGMVFTVEPGIYVEGLGGFRLSDTLAVTETGIEKITYYPTRIDQIICDL